MDSGEWTPDRPDAILVGELSFEVWEILAERVNVRQVYSTPETSLHYRVRHTHDFDVAMGEAMLATAIRNPEYVYESRKPGSIVLAVRYDETNYLTIPIKVLEEELWLQSLYVRATKRFVKDIAKAIVLYRRD